MIIGTIGMIIGASTMVASTAYGIFIISKFF